MVAVFTFLDFYFLPVLDGYTMMHEYLNQEFDGEDNYILEVTGFNADEIAQDFADKVNAEDWEFGTDEENVEKMRSILDDVTVSPIEKVFGLVIYLHAPLLVSPLVLLFLIRVATWCSNGTNRVLNLENDRQLRIWRDRT